MKGFHGATCHFFSSFGLPARVSFLDDDFLHEIEDDISWKYWSHKINGDSGDFSDYEMCEMSDNAFEGHHMLRKR